MTLNKELYYLNDLHLDRFFITVGLLYKKSPPNKRLYYLNGLHLDRKKQKRQSRNKSPTLKTPNSSRTFASPTRTLLYCGTIVQNRQKVRVHTGTETVTTAPYKTTFQVGENQKGYLGTLLIGSSY